MMYKFIVIIGPAADAPSLSCCERIFVGRSQKASRAFSEFKKQIDYLGTVICSLSVVLSSIRSQA